MTFYVYIWFLDDVAVYVGAGGRSRLRPSDHRKGDTRAARNFKIYRGQLECRVFLETDNRDDAFREEARLVALYGFEEAGGTLWNSATGGDRLGRKLSPLGVKNLAAHNREKALSPEFRAKLSAALQDPAVKARRSAAQRKAFADPEVKAQMVASAKAGWVKRREKRQ
jgi:predicted GIY-YIG superfamily endonuclease